MSASRFVYIDVLIVRESDAAFLVEFDGQEIWLPKSQVADPDGYGPGDQVELGITRWIAQEKEIEVDDD